jgi:hypothetical protein
LEMKLCSHVVTHDTGLAPNPFHGYCTSALCTPSHMNLKKLHEGDWLIGNSPKKDGNKLVYAMRIWPVLSMDQYFGDDRFQCKKPKWDGTLEEQCGDNIYFRDGDGHWKRLPSRFHNDCDHFKQDIGKDLAGHPVFIAKHLYYFGCKRVIIPHALEGVIHYGRSAHYSYSDDDLADEFVRWLEANHKPGVLGKPRDMRDHSGETGAMLTDWIADCTCQSKNQHHSDCQPKSQSSSERYGGGCP